MLTIRPDQFDSIRRYHLQKFEDEMVEHSKEFTPRHCKVLGDERLRVAVCAGIQRALHYGFTNRGSIRLIIELRFLFGGAFDSDPQYPWAQRILRSSAEQMQRAELLYEGALDYQEKVSGPEDHNTYNALTALAALAKQSLDFPADDLSGFLMSEYARIFPEKAQYVGEDGLRAVIMRAHQEAHRYQFSTPRSEVLLLALMMGFGHGCANDPLYPWIARTLHDQKIREPLSRAQRLEKKALTWIKHVLLTWQEEEKA